MVTKGGEGGGRTRTKNDRSRQADKDTETRNNRSMFEQTRTSNLYINVMLLE